MIIKSEMYEIAGLPGRPEIVNWHSDSIWAHEDGTLELNHAPIPQGGRYYTERLEDGRRAIWRVGNLVMENYSTDRKTRTTNIYTQMTLDGYQ